MKAQEIGAPLHDEPLLAPPPLTEPAPAETPAVPEPTKEPARCKSLPAR